MKTESNQLCLILSRLTNSLGEAADLTNINDPILKEFLHSHEVLHQFALLDRILEQIAANPDNPALDALFLRILSLVGRTRSRHAREEFKSSNPASLLDLITPRNYPSPQTQ